MPTYNRFPESEALVCEAIESFLRQDYPKRELVILNDTPGQELRLHLNQPAPIYVYNAQLRFPDLSSKVIETIGLAKGDCFCRWDDDDIRLKGSLTQLVGNLRDRMEWHPSRHLFYVQCDNTIAATWSGAGHNGAIWRRELLDIIGGYPRGYYNGEDQAFNNAGGRHIHVERICEDRHLQYIYRWGTGSFHVSGLPGRAGWDVIGDAPIERGTFEMVPRWDRNYEELPLRCANC